MREALFENINQTNDSLWLAKEFFNSINNMFFLRAIGYLIEGVGYGDEYSYCDFPGGLDDDEEPFEGVRFRYHDDEVVLSDEKFKECLNLACKRYGDINPDKLSEIKDLLGKQKPDSHP
ncbi:ribonuclease toxin immunity protein CdiI [Parathalassolituus penaei]|uniref:Ribonuclease toxin immunity protein CdiI n=1 Tax=Parathalassolituus penaei TaxID=2997323 RepID=A0A9X3IRR7_9GAMM|nr:ribonuclease toxin immunity protein CdiI [Parathalassolituus penaei]MCY0965151.1 ribonuclease toxin immunity protein CdiI [Parathalassolituus penaei]